MQGFVLLRGADVVEDGSGCDGCGIVADQAIAFEGANSELALDERHGEVAGPNPIFNAGAGRDLIERGGKVGAGGDEDFAGAGHENGISSLLVGVWALELGGAEFAGGNI